MRALFLASVVVFAALPAMAGENGPGEGMPKRLGQCLETVMIDVPAIPDDVVGGSAGAHLANGGEFAFYLGDGMHKSALGMAGHHVRICQTRRATAAHGKPCPKDDLRGTGYTVTDLSTGKRDTFYEDLHMCGGA